MQISQEEMSFHELRVTDWMFVRKLLEDLQADFAQRERFVVRSTERFLTAVKLFRMCEQLAIFEVENPSRKDAAFHKGILLILRGLGELLLEELRAHEDVEVKKWLGVTYEDVRAICHELQCDEQMHYGSLSESRREEILRECFGPDGE